MAAQVSSCYWNRIVTHCLAVCALCVALLLFAGGIPSAFGTVISVAPGGNDSNDGLTWAMAKQTVQTGINAAVSGDAVSGDKVWVAAGTYNERITLKSGIALYGALTFGALDPTTRHFAANASILDGQSSGCVVTAPVSLAATTAIDGFTVRNGLNVGDGAGLYAASTSPTIANCIFTNNRVMLHMLLPQGVLPGSPEFTLTVTGLCFAPDAVVCWNGTALSTTRVTSKMVTATVPAENVTSTQTPQITVYNPVENLESDPVTFYVGIRTLTGVLALERCFNSVQEITLTFRPCYGDPNVVKTVTLNPDGSYLVTNIPPGC